MYISWMAHYRLKQVPHRVETVAHYCAVSAHLNDPIRRQWTTLRENFNLRTGALSRKPQSKQHDMQKNVPL